MLADEAGMRAAHDHLELRLVEATARAVAAENLTERLLMALAGHTGRTVAAERLCWQQQHTPMTVIGA